MKVLVLEDDQELLRLILKYFDSFGYVVEKAKTIKEAKSKVSDHNYDCIILDLNLPDGTGFEFLNQNKSIRKDTGVLILSANDTLDDKLLGLDLGADDYLTKPFHLAELNARVKSIVRRKKFEGSSSIDFNEISIDSDSKTVTVNGKKLKLTKKEYELLLFLVTNKYKVVTKQSIADHIWGDYMDFPGSFDFIYSHLKNLRKKIIEQGGSDYVQTVYGIGYKFSDEE